MATTLSAMPQLECIIVDFESPIPRPKRRNRPVPSLTRFVLPALTWLTFKGVSEYLEVLAARIDAPLLEHFEVTFFHQLVFDTRQIIRFFGHQNFKLFRPSGLTLCFDLALGASIIFDDPMSYPTGYRMWDIRCKKLDWQVFSIAQICSQILSFRPSVESLNIQRFGVPHSEDEIDPMVWLQLFHSFTSVQSLEIPAALGQSIAPTLQRLTEESAAEAFPSLRSLSIVGDSDMSPADETMQQGIQPFVAARQDSGRPLLEDIIWSTHLLFKFLTTFTSFHPFSFLPPSIFVQLPSVSQRQPWTTSMPSARALRIVIHNLGHDNL
jgi:hypothetical protein